MPHHKRRRPKNRRGGCLMCKPHKMNRAEKSRTGDGHEKVSVQKRLQVTGNEYEDGV